MVPTTNAVAPAKPSPDVQPINLPRDGRSVFGWAKKMEGMFDQRLIQDMTKQAVDSGYPRGMAEWNADQIHDICISVVAHARQLRASTTRPTTAC